MKKLKKKKGYVLIFVILLSVLIFSSILSITTRSISQSNMIISDHNRNKTYYIAVAGAEMVYSALNYKEKKEDSSILENTGNMPNLSVPRNDIMTRKKNMPISHNGIIIGYADIRVDLVGIESAPGRYGSFYYKIESNGKIYNTPPSNDTDTDVTNNHIVTMFVYKDYPNNPLIFDGRKDTP